MKPDQLPELALPRPPDVKMVEAPSGTRVLDRIRRRYVRLTPEEWVRQHVLYFLTQSGVPTGLLTVEQAFLWNDQVRRADIVAYTRSGAAWMVIECKAPDVVVSQQAFDQVARYNGVVQAPYVTVTNGFSLFVAAVDAGAHSVQPLNEFPAFPLD